jgi:cytochrome d ubiquinol oxidase subunit II
MVMFWVTLLAISILLYVLLDGFDLGVGMLFGLTRNETRRRAMLGAVAPIWDGNETWLVVTAVILWGAFPGAYAALLPAFYLPLLVMLAGLILRGVAFEYRHKTQRLRWVWDLSFIGGSFAATFIQGLTVGALVEGLPMANGQYVGGDFGWFSPFAVLCGVGLCLGYALLGACWLVSKCEGDVRKTAYRLIPYLSVGLLAFLIVVFAYALVEDLQVMGRWMERPYLFVFPVIGALAAVVLAVSVRYRRDELPFPMVILIFLSAFGTLAVSFWPYMIPFVLTIDEAAAPHSSLAFMFWGEGLFVFPLMLLYTFISYRVFRGKVASMPGHY